MTGHLAPELAAAYVRELSADVRGVAVLPGHAEPPSLDGPASAMATLLDHGWVRVAEGLVVVAAGAIVVAAGPHALAGPTALDAAAAAAALSGSPLGPPPEAVEAPSKAVLEAARSVIAAT